jgi:hypothetical protein
MSRWGPGSSKTSAGLALLAAAAVLAPAGGAARTAKPVRPHPSPSQAKQQARDERHDASTVLVRFRGEPQSIAAQHRLKLGERVGKTAFYVVETNGRDPRAVAAELRRDASVAAVQLNYIRQALGAPNDPLYASDQAGYLDVVRASQGWDVGTGSSAVTIAVVDTGVDLDTPDLAGRIDAGWDFVNNDGTPDDDNGHGTMVAGIAAAAGNNGIGVAGLAWNVHVLPVKVLGANGAGTDADVASGITFAADHGAKVINLSLGGPAPSPVLQDALAYAAAHDVDVVAAAGNSGWNVPSYPAAYEDAVAVSALWTGQNGPELANFSSWGDDVDIAAPGVGIWSTTRISGAAESYGSGDGTSFASPIVAGVIALVRSQNPTWSAEQARQRVLTTAHDIGPRGIDQSYGHGIVDAYAALGGPVQGPAQPAAADSLEPNDVPERATTVTSSATATIAPEGDVDWFGVPASSSGWITFTVQAPNYTAQNEQMDAAVVAYDQSLRRLAAVDRYGNAEQEQLVVPVDAGQKIYFAVSNDDGTISPGPYTVYAQWSTDPPSRYDLPSAWDVGPTIPGSVTIGDFTGDGRSDIAMSTLDLSGDPSDDNVFLFSQRADGTLATPVRLDPGTGYGQENALDHGDFDGDGKTDLVEATQAGLAVFRQVNGTLGPPTLLPNTQVGVEVVAADVNRDGKVDLVERTAAQGLLLLVNTGGGFAAPIQITPNGANDLEVGDVTGDGLPDVVTTFYGDGAGSDGPGGVVVYAQTPTGWAPAARYNGAPGYWVDPGGTAIGDFNNDGRNDVAMTYYGNSPGAIVDVFLQGAGGTLGPPQGYSVYDVPEPLVAADMNRDGLTDLVTLHGGWNAAGVLYQQAGGTFNTKEDIPWLPYSSHYPMKALAVGDVDSDGTPDIVVAADNYGLVVVPQYSRTPVLGQGPWVAGSTPADFASGVATSIAPAIHFARALDASSVTTSTVQLIDGSSGSPVPANVSYDAVGQRATITPQAPLTGGHAYVVRIAGVVGADGVALPPAVSFRFVTGGGDTTPPETTITSAPSSPTSISDAMLAFSSNETGSTFQCELDNGGWAACVSPKKYARLGVGLHTFQARAIDQAGNIDPTPASATWEVRNDYVAPQTTITSGPSGTVPASQADATFTFTSSDPYSTFFCKLDGATAWSSCDSGKVTYTNLAGGPHTFAVYAQDEFYNVDATPASASWSIGTTDTTPPDTIIDTVPSGVSNTGNATFTFHSTESASTYECALDGAAWSACTSPKSYSGLSIAYHTFQVRAIDAAGNVDPSPATDTWQVVASCPGCPANDDFQNASTLTGSSGTVTGDTTNATRQAGEPTILGNPGGKSVWFSWTAPASGTLTLDTHGSQFDTMLAVYTGSSLTALTLAQADDDTARKDVTSSLSIAVTAGVTYRIQLDGKNAKRTTWYGAYRLNWSER